LFTVKDPELFFQKIDNLAPLTGWRPRQRRGSRGGRYATGDFQFHFVSHVTFYDSNFELERSQSRDIQFPFVYSYASGNTVPCWYSIISSAEGRISWRLATRTYIIAILLAPGNTTPFCQLL